VLFGAYWTLPVKLKTGKATRMKVKIKSLKFSNRLVSVTNYDKRVKVKLTRKSYVQLLSEAEKWPLPLRVAAELHRNGITVERFEDEMHLEQSPFSKRVYEHMMQFRLHKGVDPERVTPVLPVYLRYKSPTEAIEEKSFQGRPSEEEAQRFVRKLLKKKIEDGWKEKDFFNAVRALDTVDDEDVIKIEGNLDEDLPDVQEVIKYRTRKVPQYFALVGTDWIRASSKEEVVRLKEEAALKHVIMPVEEPKTHCCYCKFPLNELVITLRDKKGKQEHMHYSCYFMNAAKPEDIVIGTEVLSPMEGVFYKWTGGKSGWEKVSKGEKKSELAKQQEAKEETIVEPEKPLTLKAKKADPVIPRDGRNAAKKNVEKAIVVVPPAGSFVKKS
jgi:hypothetical protein